MHETIATQIPSNRAVKEIFQQSKLKLYTLFTSVLYTEGVEPSLKI